VTCYHVNMSRREGERLFEILPALDVLDGRCVRLEGGDPARITVEGGDPAAAALRFVRAGARALHLVDLDGALEGIPAPDLVRRVAEAVPEASVQAAGGYRSLDAIAAGLEAGAARIVVGTAACSPRFLLAAVRRFGEQLAVAIDARAGQVLANGWTRTSRMSVTDLAAACAAAGVAQVVVTSTERDGRLGGPDLGLLTDVLPYGPAVVAAGGIAGLDDLRQLRAIGCAGAVLGSALWLGHVRLEDALALERRRPPALGSSGRRGEVLEVRAPAGRDLRRGEADEEHGRRRARQ
jgi:phosphoribosylformimino-5-aminoimidazole carboxamide ribotide isomerase